MNPASLGPRHHLVVAGVLLVLVVLAYSNMFQCGWVGDMAHLIVDERLRATTWEDGQQSGVKRIFTEDYWWPKLSSGLYRPVTTFSYWLNWHWSCWGASKSNATPSKGCEPSILGYQVVNLLLHGCNALLVYALALQIVGKPWLAAFAAALFATHPITTEAVTNLVGRADLLAAVSVLGGLLIHIHVSSAPRHRIAWLAALMAIATLGVFSKENAVVLAGAMACYDLCFRWSQPPTWNERLRRVAASLSSYLALIPPFVAFFVARRLVFSRSENPTEMHFLDNPVQGLDLLAGRLTAVRVAGLQLWHLVWPANLSGDYSYNQIPLFEGDLSQWQDWQPLLLLAAFAAAAVIMIRFRSSKAMHFCVGFFVVSYLPTSNLLLNIGSIMADRFMYLPLCPFALGVALAVDAVSGRFAALQRALWLRLVARLGLGILILACMARTWQRNLDWQTNVTFAEANVKTSPDSFKPYVSLGSVLAGEDPVGNLDRAIQLATESIRIIDTLPDELSWCAPYVDLGKYYALKAKALSKPASDGRLKVTEPARAWYLASAATMERAISIDLAANEFNRQGDLRRGRRPDEIPDIGFADLYTHLGEAYLRLDMPDKAVATLRYARHISPSDWKACFKLSEIHLETENWEAGCIGLIACLIMDPSHLEPWPLLQRVYERINTSQVSPIQGDQGAFRLNLENPLVFEQFSRAYQDLFVTAYQGRRLQTAQTIRQAAERLGLPRDLFARITTQEDLPRPPEPVFYVRGPSLPEPPRELPVSAESH